MLAVLLVGSPFLPSPASAQRLGITKGYKVLGDNFEPPHDTQPRSLLEGATAQFLEGDNLLLTGVTLQTFKETGQRELLIKAPQCLYETKVKTASSPGPLSVQTADGKFAIQGEGFLWRQTNSSLIISNKVRTTIAPELLQDPGVAAGRRPSSRPTSPLEILADYFEYSRESGRGLYLGNVRVLNTNELSLSSQALEIKLPVEAGVASAQDALPKGLESIRAEKDVAVDYGGVRAAGQVAVYSAQTGLVRLSGQPTWRVGQREGGADELAIDITNRVFRADGNAWLKSPAQGLSIAGLLNQTNDPPRSALGATNQFVEIRSGAYEFHTNWAAFEGGVRLQELVGGRPRGQMSCESLQASFQGTNQLETLTARTNVLVQESTNWLRAGQVVLSGSNGVLVATEAPAWGAGTRSGKGDLVRIDGRANEMLVRGNASIQLPAHELADSDAFRLGSTNLAPAARFPTNDLAQIFCEEYTLRQEGARFLGGVYATHPRMNWSSESLVIDLPRTAGRTRTLVAEQAVKFQFSGEKGDRLEGAGDKAVYVFGVDNSATNDLLTLSGNPAVLQTTNVTTRSKTIIYDRARNLVRTPGYSITFTNQVADTNLLMLPKSKLTR